MSADLRVTVLSPYPFHMIDQARQLYQARVLERMVAAVPHSRIGLPGEMVSTRLRWSSFRHIARRAVPQADPILNRQVVRDFDKWAACHLGEPCLINGLSGFATQTLSQASTRGITVFCDRGSWHILEQQRVLDEEAHQIGAQRARFDPFMVERELRSMTWLIGFWFPRTRAAVVPPARHRCRACRESSLWGGHFGLLCTD